MVSPSFWPADRTGCQLAGNAQRDMPKEEERDHHTASSAWQWLSIMRFALKGAQEGWQQDVKQVENARPECCPMLAIACLLTQSSLATKKPF